LIVDDILDSGRTLSRLLREFEERGAADVRTCVLLDKPSRRAVPCEADFRVFEVPDLFVVGYGMDYAGSSRSLPYVGVLKTEQQPVPAAGSGGGVADAGESGTRAARGD
jgi:hypoxanthine phosphoribosyltransferase